MTVHDWISLASIVAVLFGGIVGFLAKRTIDRLDPTKLLLKLRTLNSSGNALTVDFQGIRVLAQ